MTISLEGRTAIVTSGGQDLGLSVATRLLESGARVMLADADERIAAETEDLIAQAEGACRRFPYVAQDKLSTANLIAATVDLFQGIDILVNAAQSVEAPEPFLETSTDAFDAALGQIVRAPFRLGQAVARRMVEQRDGDEPAGVIVNLTAIAAHRAAPDLMAFSVAFAALDQLTRAMAASLADAGIRVNGVAIGGVLTDRLKAELRDDDVLRDEMIRVTPLGRLADQEEATETVLFLASDCASFITGQIVAVDGGRTLLDPLVTARR